MKHQHIIRYTFTIVCIFLFTMFAHAEKSGLYGSTCTATSVTPSTVNFTALLDEGPATITVTTSGNCANYSVTLLPSWLSYTKNGMIVTLTAQPNNGSARSANINIGGLTVTVTQEAPCAAAPAAGAITGASSVCPGQSNVSYSITKIFGINDYTWNYTGTGATITGTYCNVTISFGPNATSGILTVSGIGSCGLVGPSSPSFPISVNPAPSITVSPSLPLCEGSTFNLNGPAGMSSYLWTGPNNVTGTSQTLTITSASAELSSGTYTLTATRPYGCSNSASTQVTIYPLTPLVMPIERIIYEESVLVLEAPGGMTSYSWTGPLGFSSTSQNPTVSSNVTSRMAGTYSLTATNNNQCTSSASTLITVKAHDNSLPLGSIGGGFNVSSSGAATYQIPIFVSPGTAGMVPDVSVIYNSHDGNGFLGMGCSLSGFSAIKRLSKTLKDDGQVGAVQLNSSDPFGLDGNRLVVTNNGTYGANNTEYHTQNETFVRVTSYGSSGSGPQWFKVETKDGRTIEYGNSATSYLQAANKDEIIFWSISKITDANGNYITYTYHVDRAKGEFWPEKIEYTGNADQGLTPYNSINFSYQANPEMSTTYVAGSAIAHNVLLNKITTVNEGNTVREYDFNYPQNSSHLNEVVEYGVGHVKINSTIVSWLENAENSEAFTTPFKYSTSFLFDDFNGDGKTEIISDDNVHIYEINSNRTSFTDLGNSGLSIGITDAKSGDFNGDGKSDIIGYPFSTSASFTYFKSNGNNFTFIGSYGAISRKGTKVFPGDFNGDGFSDVMVHDSVSNTLTVFWGNAVSPFSSSANITTINWGTKQYFKDINGDGKQEVITFDNSGYEIFEYQNSVFQLTQSNSQPSSKYDVYFGDFNGDGKSDFIYKFLGNNFYVNISTGANFVSVSQVLTVGTFDNMWAGDMNGDGRDEFVGDIAAYAWKNNSLVVCGSNDIPEKPTKLYIQDFDGDGAIDCLWSDQSASTSPVNVQFNFSSITRHAVSSITNGMENNIQISYKPLTDNTVHTLLTDGAYRSIDVASNLQVVSSVTADNGIGGVNQLNYHYTGAKYDNRDGQFLGFAIFTQTNNTSGIVSTNYSDIDKTYYFNKPTKSEVKTTSGTPLTETSYSITIRDFGNNCLFIYIGQQTSIDHLHGDAAVTSSIVYNDDGNPTSTTSSAGGISTSTTTNTFTTTNSWCPNKILTTSTTRTRTGETNYTTSSSFSYYPNGQLQQVISEPGDLKKVYTNYYYNSYGNLYQSKVSPDGITGRVTNFEYDAKQRAVTKTTDVYGHYTENTYDWGLGAVTQVKDHNNLITQYAYDAFGRLTQTTAPDQNVSTVSYNWATGINVPTNALYTVTTSVPGSPSGTVWYDKLGRPILSQGTGLDGTKVYSQTVYNSKGQVDYVTLPYYEGGSNADRKTFTYDALGRVTSEIAPGVNMSYAYNGLTATITDNIKGQTYTREVDATGALKKATDAGGDINYTYNAQGQVRQVVASGNTITTTYDQFGRQTSLTDPNTGTYSYQYNVYGELIKQIDPLTRSTDITYDNIGRITTCNNSTINTSYTYKPNGLPDVISADNYIDYSYTYDSYLRTTQKSEDINGTVFNTSYEYDTYGRVSKVTYPSGFAVSYQYKNGYLEEIKRADNGQSIWKVNTMNSKGQITQSTSGNGLVTDKTYSTEGYLKTIVTGTGGSVQNLAYSYNAKGLMEWRQDKRHSYITEYFGYDNLNRLNSITLGSSVKNIGYSNNGNITSQTGIGTYSYNAQKTNAVEKLSNNPGAVSNEKQTINYSAFNKIVSIDEGNNYVNFTYGPDYSRKYTQSQINYELAEKYYSDNYESEMINGNTRELHYITAYGQIVAIFEKKSSGEEEMYYVHTDHLGSLNIITNSTGAIVNEMSFDAWGNRRNPATWRLLPSNGGVGGGLITNRGFTGHEHMDAFGLINMNGRVYDPALGRFLSPDPFIANPTSTQDFNRYSYVVNNPLMFIDPSGYNLMYFWDQEAADREAVRGLFAGGHNDGSIFPRMGEMGSPRDNLAYDLALATNWYNATGDYSSIDAVRSGVERGSYYGSGVTTYSGGAAQYVFAKMFGIEAYGVRSSRTSRGYAPDEKGHYGVYSVLKGDIFKVVLGVWMGDGSGTIADLSDDSWASRFWDGFKNGGNTTWSNPSDIIGAVDDVSIGGATNWMLLDEFRASTTSFTKLKGLAGAIQITEKVSRSFGIAAGISTIAEGMLDQKGLTPGDIAKASIAFGTTFAGWYGVAFGLTDIVVGISTGTTLTDRIGNGIDSAFKY